jgi:hypothetical protein
MTNIRDVIQQIEKTICDREFPPTPRQLETCTRILNNLCSGTVAFQGSR